MHGKLCKLHSSVKLKLLKAEAKLYAKECKDAAVIAEQNFDRLEFQYEDAPGRDKGIETRSQ